MTVTAATHYSEYSLFTKTILRATQYRYGWGALRSPALVHCNRFAVKNCSYRKPRRGFRDASRKEDADMLRRAFNEGQSTQAEISRNAARELETITPRQVINWLQERSDMPSWAVKLTQKYLDKIEDAARRIENKDG